MKTKKIEIEFLHTTIVVCVVADINDYRNRVLYSKYPQLGKCEESSIEALHTHDYDYYPGYNWLTFTSLDNPGLIAHEAVHVAEAIDRYFLIESEEFRAYIVQYIVTEITNWAKTFK